MADDKKLKAKKLMDLFWKAGASEEVHPTAGKDLKTKNPSSTVPPSPGITDQKVSDYLLKVFESSNIPGHDYFELKQALKAMENLPIEENAKYKAAFATLSTMGVTVDQLIGTATQYVTVFNNEKEKFVQASVKQTDEKVKSKETEIQKLTDISQKKAEQIQQFTNEINENHNQIAKLKEEVAIETAKISSTKSNFETTLNSFVAQIQDDLNKIKSYLKSS